MLKTAKRSPELTSWTGNGALVEVCQASLLPLVRVLPPEPIKAAESRIPTAETIKALAELRHGKLNRYADEDELFKKLGIKVGKT
jgi:hypothetical protein